MNSEDKYIYLHPRNSKSNLKNVLIFIITEVHLSCHRLITRETKSPDQPITSILLNYIYMSKIEQVLIKLYCNPNSYLTNKDHYNFWVNSQS